MNYYPRHIGDYAKDTRGLSFAEHGAYALLLDLYYDIEGPIPDEEKYDLTGARGDDEKAAIDKVLRRFFTLEDGQWRNKRADEEIAKSHAKAEKAQQSAKRRWGDSNASAKPADCEADADAMRTHSDGNAPQKPKANSQEPITTTTSACPRATEVLNILQEVPGYARATGETPERIAQLFGDWPEIELDDWPKIARQLRNEALQRPLMKENSVFTASPAGDLGLFVPKWKAAQARGQPTPTAIRKPGGKMSAGDLYESVLSEKKPA